MPAEVCDYALSEDDRRLVAAVRAGDEAAFATLVDMYGASMLRLARAHVPSRAVAEEVVQETWLAVLDGIDRFEGRSSLKTWIFRILANRAKTRGERERRTVPFSSLGGDDDAPAVAPERFLPADHERVPHHWAAPPRRWRGDPEARLLSKETLAVIRDAIASLPDRQRLVLALRDVEGWSAEEVRNALELSETNQRVILHRGRAKVRQVLEDHLGEADD